MASFSVTARGSGKVLISWRNQNTQVTQISIQRSADSLKNFTTLLTVVDPHLPENGAVDNKAPLAGAYYRLFVVLQNGKYFFTKAKWPAGAPPALAGAADASRPEQRIVYVVPAIGGGKPEVQIPSSIQDLPRVEVEKTVYVKKEDSIIARIPGTRIAQYRDSLLSKTKDTLIFIDGDSLLIKPYVPKDTYRVSPYVFTGKYGNIHIMLPDALKKHYLVKFFDDNNKLLFELNAIKDATLILDKTNFQHAGWFRFELFEGGVLKERNKLFIPKDF